MRSEAEESEKYAVCSLEWANVVWWWTGEQGLLYVVRVWLCGKKTTLELALSADW